MQLNIPNPCSASWRTMSPTEHGRHCASCSKEVVDFASLDDKAIADYIEANSASTICGRFRTHQLNRSFAPTTISSSYTKYGKWIVAALLIGSSHLVFANEIVTQQSQQIVLTDVIKIEEDLIELMHKVEKDLIVKGRLVDAETGDVIIGANVIVENLNLGTISDFDGNFELNISKSSSKFLNKISISFIGYSNIEIELSEKQQQLLVQNEVLDLSIIALEEASHLLGEIVITKKNLRKVERKERRNRDK